MHLQITFPRSDTLVILYPPLEDLGIRFQILLQVNNRKLQACYSGNKMKLQSFEFAANRPHWLSLKINGSTILNLTGFPW